MNWWRNLLTTLRIIPVPVGHDNDGVDRPLLSAGTDIDKEWGTLYAEQEDSRAAWRKNPMARRIVNLTTSYVVGAGIKIESDHSGLKQFLADFWSHPQNRLDNRLHDWCDELARAGELFIALFPNRIDGMLYVRSLPSSQIESVEWKEGDYETELAYMQTPAHIGAEPKRWDSAAGLAQREQSRGHIEADAPIMLHFAVNRPVGAVRGEGDLVVILPWLRRYNRWLEDRVRLNAAVRAFLWIVKAPRQAVADLKERWQSPPEPGTVIITDEKESWEAVAPNLSARDAAADGRAIRWMVAAGGPGTALTDFGEGEDANLATAKTMAEQRRRFLLRRQAYFAALLAELAVHAYNRSLRIRPQPAPADPADAPAPARPAPAQPATYADARVIRPDISVSDNELVAKALLDLIQGIAALRSVIGDGDAFRRYALRLFVRYSEEPVSAREFERLLQGKRARGGPGLTPAGAASSQPGRVQSALAMAGCAQSRTALAMAGCAQSRTALAMAGCVQSRPGYGWLRAKALRPCRGASPRNAPLTQRQRARARCARLFGAGACVCVPAFV